MDALLDRPLPADWTVRRGLERYLAENGFTKEAYDEPTTTASFLGVAFKIPNTAAHRAAIMRHDLHHVATGYGTDLRGEAEISVWETKKGLGGLDAYVTAIVLNITVLGWFMAPLRMRAALQAAKGKGNLFQEKDYEGLLDLTIAELRDRLGVPREGLGGRRELHAQAPRVLAAA